MSDMTESPRRDRRRLVTLGVAGAALVAGGGLAWWQASRDETQNALPPGFWDLRFTQPAGGELALAELKGRPLLVNFWATWCPPCVEELPLLDRFAREQPPAGVKVIGLAIDQPSAVRQFLARMPVGFPIGLAGFGGTELTKTLGNLSGGLPFSVAVDRAGQVRQRRMGKLSGADLQQWQQVL